MGHLTSCSTFSRHVRSSALSRAERYGAERRAARCSFPRSDDNARWKEIDAAGAVEGTRNSTRFYGRVNATTERCVTTPSAKRRARCAYSRNMYARVASRTEMREHADRLVSQNVNELDRAPVVTRRERRNGAISATQIIAKQLLVLGAC